MNHPLLPLLQASNFSRFGLLSLNTNPLKSSCIHLNQNSPFNLVLGKRFFLNIFSKKSAIPPPNNVRGEKIWPPRLFNKRPPWLEGKLYVPIDDSGDPLPPGVRGGWERLPGWLFFNWLFVAATMLISMNVIDYFRPEEQILELDDLIQKSREITSAEDLSFARAEKRAETKLHLEKMARDRKEKEVMDRKIYEKEKEELEIKLNNLTQTPLQKI